jgi:predicted amidohydrolase
MSFQVVIAQLNSTDKKEENLRKAKKALEEAKSSYKADLVVFPEGYMSIFPFGTPGKIKFNDAESLEDHFVTGMCKLAKKHEIWIVFGMREKIEDNKRDNRVYNSVIIVDSNGKIISTYRKTHLYDAFGVQESLDVKPGDALFEPIETPFGKIGLFVCYELRFPEIARYQAIHGADIIIVLAGWVKGLVKELHWKTLVTARALENTTYVIACNQVSDLYIGQSLIVDPMGITVASGNEQEELIPCRIELERVKEVRSKLPSHRQRRAELYH